MTTRVAAGPSDKISDRARRPRLLLMDKNMYIKKKKYNDGVGRTDESHPAEK